MLRLLVGANFNRDTIHKGEEMADHRFKTTDIKGRPYISVNERIKYFREVYPPPQGRINTIMEDNKRTTDGGMCLFRAEIFIDDVLVASGTAQEWENDKTSFVNKTSYVENCETSAIGRALGILGIGIEQSIASAEEVQNAMAQQEAKKGTMPKPTPEPTPQPSQTKPETKVVSKKEPEPEPPVAEAPPKPATKTVTKSEPKAWDDPAVQRAQKNVEKLRETIPELVEDEFYVTFLDHYFPTDKGFDGKLLRSTLQMNAAQCKKAFNQMKEDF